jgi:hypothetical protein
LRAVMIMLVFGVLGQFTFKCVLFALRELVDPGRPKAENEFGNALLTVGPESWVLIAAVVLKTVISFLNGIPTRVVLTGDALVVVLRRANRISKDLDGKVRTIIVPRHAVVSARPWGHLSGCERLRRCLFVEQGTPSVKASHWFTTTESKDSIVVKKYCAKDPAKGREIEGDLSYWQFLEPSMDGEQATFTETLGTALGRRR